MSEPDFEARLGGQLRAYAQAGVRPIDRFAIAESIVAARSRRGLVSGVGQPRWWEIRLAHRVVLVMVLAVASVALVGGSLILSAGHQAVPSPGPTTAPPSPSSTLPAPSTATTDPSLPSRAVPDNLRGSWVVDREITGGPPGGQLSIGERYIWAKTPGPPYVLQSDARMNETGSLTLIATNLSTGCAVGAVGTYSYLISADSEVMTLYLDGDACDARPALILGTWRHPGLHTGPTAAP